MHGRKRNAEEYRDQWSNFANELNLVVVVPEFSEAHFLWFGAITMVA